MAILTIFKRSAVLLSALFGTIIYSSVAWSQIPVTDVLTGDKVSSGSKMIGAQIMTQTDALVAVLDGATIHRNHMQIQTVAAQVRKENAELYDPSMGAVPRDVCAIAAIGANTAAGRRSQRIGEQNLSLAAKLSGEAAAEISQLEDVDEFNARNVVADSIVENRVVGAANRGEVGVSVQMAVSADSINGAKTFDNSTPSESLGGKTPFAFAVSQEYRRLDPSPPEMDPALMTEDANPEDAGSALRLKMHAEAVEYNNTMEVSKSVINRLMLERENSLDASMVQKLAQANNIEIDDLIINGKISPAAQRSFMNKYRIQSSGEWLLENDSGSEIAVLKIANKIAAQTLANQEAIIQRLDEQNRVMANLLAVDRRILSRIHDTPISE